MGLFRSSRGPIRFHLVGLGSEAERIKNIIFENGGEVTDDGRPPIINFTTPESYAGDKRMFDVRYITECVKENKILDLHHFALGRWNDPAECCPSSVFLHGKLCEVDVCTSDDSDECDTQFCPEVTSTQNDNFYSDQNVNEEDTANKVRLIAAEIQEAEALNSCSRKYCDMGMVVEEVMEDAESDSSHSSIKTQLIGYARLQLEMNQTSSSESDDRRDHCSSDAFSRPESVCTSLDVVENLAGAERNPDIRFEDDCSNDHQVVMANNELREHTKFDDNISEFSMASTVTIGCQNVSVENRFSVHREQTGSSCEDCSEPEDPTFGVNDKKTGARNVDEELEASKNDNISLIIQNYSLSSSPVVYDCQNSHSSKNDSSDGIKRTLGSDKEDDKTTDTSRSDPIYLSTPDFDPLGPLNADQSRQSYSSEDFVSSSLQEMIRNEKEMEPEKDVEKNAQESECNDILLHTEDYEPLSQPEAVQSEDSVRFEAHGNNIENDSQPEPEEDIEEEAVSNGIIVDTQDYASLSQASSDERDTNSSEDHVNSEQQSVIVNDDKIEPEKDIDDSEPDNVPAGKLCADRSGDANVFGNVVNDRQEETTQNDEQIGMERNIKGNTDRSNDTALDTQDYSPRKQLGSEKDIDTDCSENNVTCRQLDVIENDEPMELEKDNKGNVEVTESNSTVSSSQYYTPPSQLSIDKDPDTVRSEHQVVSTQQEKDINENADTIYSSGTVLNTQYHSFLSQLDAHIDIDCFENLLTKRQQEIIENDKLMEPENDIEGNADESESNNIVLDTQNDLSQNQLGLVKDRDINCVEDRVFSSRREIVENDQSIEIETDIQVNADQSEYNSVMLDTQDYEPLSQLNTNKYRDIGCSEDHEVSSQQEMIANDQQIEQKKNIKGNVDESNLNSIDLDSLDYDPLSQLSADKNSDTNCSEDHIVDSQQEIIQADQPIKPEKNIEGNVDETKSNGINLDSLNHTALSEPRADEHRDVDYSKDQSISSQKETIGNHQTIVAENDTEGKANETESKCFILDTQDYALLVQLDADSDRNTDCSEDHVISSQEEIVENDQLVELEKEIYGNVDESRSYDIVLGTHDYALPSQLSTGVDTDSDISEHHVNSAKKNILMNDELVEIEKNMVPSIQNDVRHEMDETQDIEFIDNDSNSVNQAGRQERQILDETDSNDVAVSNQDYMPLVTLQKVENSHHSPIDVINLENDEIVDNDENREEVDDREESVNSTNYTNTIVLTIGYPASRTSQDTHESLDIDFANDFRRSTYQDCTANGKKEGREEKNRNELNKTSANLIVSTNQDFISLEILESVENRNFPKGDTHSEVDKDVEKRDQSTDESVNFDTNDILLDTQDFDPLSSSDTDADGEYACSKNSADDGFPLLIYKSIEQEEDKSDDAAINITIVDDRLITLEEDLDAVNLDFNNSPSIESTEIIESDEGMKNEEDEIVNLENLECSLVDLTNDTSSTPSPVELSENLQHTTNITSSSWIEKQDKITEKVKFEFDSNHSATENNLPLSGREKRYIDAGPLNERSREKGAPSYHENHVDSDSCDSLIIIEDSNSISADSCINVSSSEKRDGEPSEPKQPEKKRNRRRKSNRSRNIPRTADKLQMDSEDDVSVSETENESTEGSSAKIRCIEPSETQQAERGKTQKRGEEIHSQSVPQHDDRLQMDSEDRESVSEKENRSSKWIRTVETLHGEPSGSKQSGRRRNEKKDRISKRNVPKSDYRIQSDSDDNESVSETERRSTKESSTKIRCEEPSGSKQTERRKTEKRLQTDSDDSDTFTDDSFTRDSCEKSKRRKTQNWGGNSHRLAGSKRNFEVWEKRKMINYLIERNAIEYSRGMSIWQQMSQERVLDRTANSLNNHFRKTILPEIKHFNLKPEVLKQFLKLRK